MSRPQVQENSWAILRYLEVLWQRYERMTTVPETPMNRKEKGLSKPPVSDNALKLMLRNREASARLEPLLRELRRHDVSHGGVRANEVLDAVRDDPGSVRRWRAAHDTDTPGPDRDRWRALRAVCVLLAQALESRHGGAEPYVLDVQTDPRDEEARSRVQAAARDREAKLKDVRERGRQKRLERLREIRRSEEERYGECSVESAMRLWMSEAYMSWDTIRRAITNEPEEEELRQEKGAA